MSKPREFWIDDKYPDVWTEYVSGAIHVIEKSAADKLAEVLEFYSDPSNKSYCTNDYESMARQALREYRGES